MVDTSAAVNVIDELTYNSLLNKPDLLHLNNTYYEFGNPNKSHWLLRHNSHLEREVMKSRFHRNGGRRQNIIGRKSAKAIGMVTFNLHSEPENEPNVNQVATKTELNKDELASMFPELFSCKLGRIKDTEVKLVVDENIKPINQPLRPIESHYRNKIRSKKSWRSRLPKEF